MRHISVDPYEQNGIMNAGVDSYSTMPGATMSSNMLQMQLMTTIMKGLNFIKFDNPMIDGIITVMMQSLLIGLISVGMTQLGHCIENLKKMFRTAIYLVTFLGFNIRHFVERYILRRDIRKKIMRTVDIPYISDNRQINELYKAVYWYLTNDAKVKYQNEPFLQYVFDKKITQENKEQVRSNLGIHKVLTQNQTKTIAYKSHQITYSLRTDLIKVYTDKDRQRENHKVILNAIVYENADTDILCDFCQFCLTEYINHLTSETWKQLIYTNNGSAWTSTPSNNSRKLNTIVLKNGQREDIHEDLQLFLDSEEWYAERDIPYTRGYLFYGFPGTGKTSMIKAMSLYCRRHIHYLMLNEVRSDTELLELLRNINYSETILVLEDIDAMVNIVKSREEEEEKKVKAKAKRDKKSKKLMQESKLTLSGLLNAIDGVFTCHGRILIMTTNRPEILDSALIRPGRVDSKYMFDLCDTEQISNLYRMFYGENPDPLQLTTIESNKYSPAHISSVFMRYRKDSSQALLNLESAETKIVLPIWPPRKPVPAQSFNQMMGFGPMNGQMNGMIYGDIIMANPSSNHMTMTKDETDSSDEDEDEDAQESCVLNPEQVLHPTMSLMHGSIMK